MFLKQYLSNATSLSQQALDLRVEHSLRPIQEANAIHKSVITHMK